MPDTRGQGGQEHFAEAARVIEETSSDGRFSTYTVTPGTGGDGPQIQQVRGKPPAPKTKKK